MTETKETKRAMIGFILSLLGGIINAIVAVILIAAMSLLAGLESYIPGAGGLGLALSVWFGIGLIISIVVIVGAILIYMPGKEMIGGILVLIFSIISYFFTGGGFFIGLILGVIGGILGIMKK